jgi:4'-phosphopantetheinyl transferase
MATAALRQAEVVPWLDRLDDEEKERARRFAFAADRIPFIAAHVLARAALAAATGAPPAAFTFARGAHGKPEALLAGRPTGVSFSLSHTEGMVGVAVARAAALPLGFDLEVATRIVSPAVVRRCFTPAELAPLQEGTAAARSAGLMRLWTLKEAFVKATGEGLGQDLHRFWFQLAPPAIVFVQGGEQAARGWHFRQRRLAGGFLGALGWRGSGGVAVWRQLAVAELAASVPLRW